MNQIPIDEILMFIRIINLIELFDFNSFIKESIV